MGGKGSGRYKDGSPRPPVGVAKHEDAPTKIPGDINHRSIGLGLEMMELGDIDDWSDASELRERFMKCLNICDKWDIKPIVSNIALGFGISANVFQDIVLGRTPRYKGLTQEGLRFLQKCYDFLRQNLENNLIDERGNPVKWIFLGKNYFGLTDQTERVVKHVDAKPELPQAEKTVNKYASLVGAAPQQLPEAEVLNVEDVPEIVVEEDDSPQVDGTK